MVLIKNAETSMGKVLEKMEINRILIKRTRKNNVKKHITKKEGLLDDFNTDSNVLNVKVIEKTANN